MFRIADLLRRARTAAATRQPYTTKQSPIPKNDRVRPMLTQLEDRTVPATLSGTAFADSNLNGVQDTGEAGVAGVVVTASPAAGGQLTDTTDATGHYEIDGIPYGSCTDSITAPAGYTVSSTSETTYPGFYVTDPDTDAFTLDIGLGGGPIVLAFDDVDLTAPGVPATVNVLDDAFDLNQDPLTLSSAAGAAHGSLDYEIGGSAVTYTPDAGFLGTDSFSYTVSDPYGNTVSANVSIDVWKPAPAVVDDAVVTPVNQPVSVDLLSDAYDLYGDTLTVTTAGGAGHGTVSLSGGGATYTPDTGYAGPDSFGFTVSDSYGQTASGTIYVEVGDPYPVAAVSNFAATPPGEPVTVNLLGTAYSFTGEALTVAGVGNAADGSVTLNGDGTATYTPTAGFAGVDSFTFTIADTDSNTATGTITVIVWEQHPPVVALTATAVTAPGEPVTVDALGNASSLTGDTLTVTAAGGAGHGTVVLNQDGTVTYTPDAGYSGTDSFTYTVADTNSNTATGTITVTVAASAPVVAGATASTTTGTAVTVDLLGNRTGLTVTAIGTPAHGSAVLNGDGTVTYTPEPGFDGIEAFAYTLSDASGNTVVSTASVNVSLPTGPTGYQIAATATFTPVPPIDPSTDPSLLPSVEKLSGFFEQQSATFGLSAKIEDDLAQLKWLQYKYMTYQQSVRTQLQQPVKDLDLIEYYMLQQYKTKQEAMAIIKEANGLKALYKLVSDNAWATYSKYTDVLPIQEPKIFKDYTIPTLDQLFRTGTD